MSGRKWSISWVDRSHHVMVMCRAEPDDVPYQAFSMIVVPTDAPDFRMVGEVLGFAQRVVRHFELEFDEVARTGPIVCSGPRGAATLSLPRGRTPSISSCRGWAWRSGIRAAGFAGAPMPAPTWTAAGRYQLVQQMIFDSYCEIQSARLMVLHTGGAHGWSTTRVEIGAIQVQCARMVHDVVDRAMQVYGGEGMTSNTPLEAMHRHARYGRIVDGPDKGVSSGAAHRRHPPL